MVRPQRVRKPTIRAVLMLGGRSSRMRATRGPEHKMLVEVVGVPILERNIGYLLAAGFRDLVAITSAEEPEVMRFLESRGRALAAARGSRLEWVVESRPLGTIGAVQLVARPGDVLFVMAADNLTGLDPRRLVAHHRRCGAAMTVATHEYELRMPFGEVEVAGGWIRRYLEKPVRRVRISSGIYVVGAEAAALIPAGSRCGAPELVARLLGAKRPVASYAHDAPWIDVNDRAALLEAEDLVKGHPKDFELWRTRPDVETASVVGRRAGRIAVRREEAGAPSGSGRIAVRREDAGARSGSGRIAVRSEEAGARSRSGLWVLPELPGGPGQPERTARAIRALFGSARGFRRLAVFDELDVRTRRVIRRHIYCAEVDRLPRTGDGYKWLALSSGSLPADAAPSLRRAIAYLED